MGDLLRVKDLRVEFRTPHMTVRAVDGVRFRIRPGGTVALVGESGSGKSTVAQAILGILPKNGRVTGGEILFADPEKPGTLIDLARLKPHGREMRDIRGGRISMIFQEPMTSLSPLHTIGDQIEEAVRLHRRAGRREAREMAQDMLAMVEFPDPRKALKTHPFELSGGLRQRAMIAMALVCHPALLIADEPTTALDVTIQAQTLKLIRDLQRELGMAVLLITHDLGVVANMAEEVVVAYGGRVLESAPVEALFRRPHHQYSRSLLAAVPHFDMKPGERLQPIRDIPVCAGNLLRAHEHCAAADQEPGELLRVEGVEKSYGLRQEGVGVPAAPSRVVAVRDASFTIQRGECVGLVGESGCGKTTLSKIIMRAIAPDRGRVLFNDNNRMVDLTALRDAQLTEYRRRIQFVFQDPFGALNPRMSVFDIVSEPLVIHGVGDATYRTAMVKELMAVVGLDPHCLNRYPHSFSGGQRQRIGIARALALKPDLILLDEPTSALDVSVQAQILNLLKDLQVELGLTYLFISHNLAVVDYIADRIMVMCAGRLVESAPREVLFRDPRHPYTQALLSAVPFADLDHRLDFSKIAAGRASVPTAWPAPFTIDPSEEPPLCDLGGGHFVRMHQQKLEAAS